MEECKHRTIEYFQGLPEIDWCSKRDRICTGCHQGSDDRIIDYWRTAPPFDPENIPETPRLYSKERYTTELVPEIIRRGGIPKEDLIPGTIYSGGCRNTDQALWDGTVFKYRRVKFGVPYEDTVNHFEDDDGYDLFIPVKPL